MDSLFLGCLVLFFLQGVFERDNRIARGLCMLFASPSALAVLGNAALTPLTRSTGLEI